MRQVRQGARGAREGRGAPAAPGNPTAARRAQWCRGGRRSRGTRGRERHRRDAAGPRIASGTAAFQCRPNAVANFSRRDNTNYMETGVLSSLQLTSMFPNVVVENFYIKTRNSIQDGKTNAPYGFVIPAQRDMTKPAELVNILRAQGIEVGLASLPLKIGDDDVSGRLVRHQARSAIWPPGQESPRKAGVPRRAPDNL